MEWTKNEGKVSTPPTQQRVDIELSETSEGHPDGIWCNQDPNRWDWLKQSCMILRWRISNG